MHKLGTGDLVCLHTPGQAARLQPRLSKYRDARGFSVFGECLRIPETIEELPIRLGYYVMGVRAGFICLALSPSEEGGRGSWVTGTGPSVLWTGMRRCCGMAANVTRVWAAKDVEMAGLEPGGGRGCVSAALFFCMVDDGAVCDGVADWVVSV